MFTKTCPHSLWMTRYNQNEENGGKNSTEIDAFSRYRATEVVADVCLPVIASFRFLSLHH